MGTVGTICGLCRGYVRCVGLVYAGPRARTKMTCIPNGSTNNQSLFDGPSNVDYTVCEQDHFFGTLRTLKKKRVC